MKPIEPMPTEPTQHQIVEDGRYTARPGYDVPIEARSWFLDKLVRGIPKSTLTAYRHAAKGLAKHCTDYLPDDLAVLNRLKELDDGGYSISSMRLAVASANRARKLAGEQPLGVAVKMAVASIAAGRRMEGHEPKQAVPIRNAHLPAIDAAAQKPRRRETEAKAAERANLDAVIVRLGRKGLLRVGELCGLTLDDLEPREGGGATLAIRRSKGGREGAIVIGEALLARINAVPRAEGERRIVPLSPVQVWRRLKAATEAAGIKGASTHSLRVGMTRDLVAGGASLIEVQNAGGWR